MTKERAPVTIENALFKVLGAIGTEKAAEITGRDGGYLRSLSDPDTRFRLTVEDAIKLDIAYAEVREPGTAAIYPLLETYGRLLEVAAAQRFADAQALHLHAITLVEEGGQAQAALLRAALPNSGPADLKEALRQLEESHEAHVASIRRVRELLQQGGTMADNTPDG